MATKKKTAKKKTAKKKTTKQVRRKKSRVNKSQAVRDYMASNPDAKPREVSEELGKRGVKITPQAVSTIKFQAKKQGGITPARRGRPARGRGVDIETLVEAKKLADRMGGVAEAKRALDMLAKLR